jgi:ankyrin repeat protein
MEKFYPNKQSQNKTALAVTQEAIRQQCNAIMELLLKKNADYGDSAINPIRIFSQADNIEQINVRLDDKLSRIKNQKEKNIEEDTELDLIGYLILKRIALKIKKECREEPK